MVDRGLSCSDKEGFFLSFSWGRFERDFDEEEAQSILVNLLLDNLCGEVKHGWCFLSEVCCILLQY